MDRYQRWLGKDESPEWLVEWLKSQGLSTQELDQLMDSIAEQIGGIGSVRWVGPADEYGGVRGIVDNYDWEPVPKGFPHAIAFFVGTQAFPTGPTSELPVSTLLLSMGAYLGPDVPMDLVRRVLFPRRTVGRWLFGKGQEVSARDRDLCVYFMTIDGPFLMEVEREMVIEGRYESFHFGLSKEGVEEIEKDRIAFLNTDAFNRHSVFVDGDSIYCYAGKFGGPDLGIYSACNAEGVVQTLDFVRLRYDRLSSIEIIERDIPLSTFCRRPRFHRPKG